MRVIKVQRSDGWVPLLVLVAGLILLYLFWDVLVVFLLAAFFAFIINPVVEIFNRKLPRALSIISVFLIIAALLIIIITLLVPLVAEQFRQLANALPTYLDQARSLFDSIQERYVGLPSRWRSVADTALSEIQQLVIRVTRESLPTVFSFLIGIVTLFIVPLLAFFMLLGYPGYKQMLIAVTPRRHRETIDDLLTCTSRTLWKFIRGELALMTIVGTVTGFGLYFVGMPYPAAFGVLAGLFEVIPNFGPISTSVIVGIIALVINPILMLKALAVTIGVQLAENSFAPIIMGRAVGLSPVTVAFAIFLGAYLGGILGALAAIPLAMTIKIVILYFYAREEDLPNKGAEICRPSQGQRRCNGGRRPAPHDG